MANYSFIFVFLAKHKLDLMFSNSVSMGPTEIQSSEIVKIPTANYEFGANYIDPKVYISCFLVLQHTKLFELSS